MSQARTLLPILLVLIGALLLPACPKGGAATTITGRIVARRGGELVPVADAQVHLWPVRPGAKPEKFEAEAIQNLRGVSTTRSTGAFEVSTLSSPVSLGEYPLLRGYTYGIEVEVPGYYITSSEFDYAGGGQYVEVEIEERIVDVLDTSGGAQSNDKELVRGAVRKE